MEREKELLFSKRDGIAAITFNRPAHLNRLTLEMMEESLDILKELEEREEERVLVFTGAGEEHFCMGLFDPHQRGALSNKDVWRRVNRANQLLAKIEELPVAVIGAINGKTLGGGLELLLACDIRVACSHASFRLPETAWGVFPGAGAPVRLPRVIGPGRAKEMMFTGREVEVDEAERIGLVDKVVASDSFRAEVQKLAETIRDSAPLGIRAVKKIVNVGMSLSIAEAQVLSDVLRRPLDDTEDSREAIQAFMEKRKPRYRGR